VFVCSKTDITTMLLSTLGFLVLAVQLTYRIFLFIILKLLVLNGSMPIIFFQNFELFFHENEHLLHLYDLSLYNVLFLSPDPNTFLFLASLLLISWRDEGKTNLKSVVG
jgi:hypothetical protein